MESFAKEFKCLKLISDDFCSPIIIIDSAKKITFTNKGNTILYFILKRSY